MHLLPGRCDICSGGEVFGYVTPASQGGNYHLCTVMYDLLHQPPLSCLGSVLVF